MQGKAFYTGDIVFTENINNFTSLEQGCLVVENGLIVEILKKVPPQSEGLQVTDFGRSLIIPSFTDLHLHAPQFKQSGTGLDSELLDWLKRYTFPMEERFADPSYAREVYSLFATELVHQGTLRVSVLGTIHLESNLILARCLSHRGLAAFVGKVNMDRNCPESLCEKTEESLAATEQMITELKGSAFVQPIITPRFAPTSTEKLLKGLGEMASRHGVPVQSHLGENRSELNWVKELFPARKSYSDVYRHYGLLGQTPTLMAHGIYLSAEEVKLLREEGVMLVHCPESNINLASGIMPARRRLNEGIKLALGSDIGAGHSLPMNRVLVRAVQLSKLFSLAEPGDKPLATAEAFYLATKAGGSFFGRCGSFEKGFSFDALVIEDDPFITAGLKPPERLQRFLYTGEASDIRARYLAGRKIG